MSIIYVRSTDGSDSDNGSTWALAKATLVGACAIDAAGDTIVLSQVHAESQSGAYTFVGAGSNASPNMIVCGNDSAAPPTASAATAALTSTTAGMTFQGQGYYYGIAFQVATSITFDTATGGNTFENCTFITTNTGSGGAFTVNANNQINITRFINCKFKFNGANNRITTDGRVEFINCSILSGSATPTDLFKFGSSTGRGSYARVDNFDFSNLGTGFNLLDPTGIMCGLVQFRNCRFPASWAGAIYGTTKPANPAARGEVYASGNFGDNSAVSAMDMTGTQSTYTSLYRNGTRALDSTAAPLSWLVTPSSVCSSPMRVFKTTEFAIWNPTVGSAVTVTVQVARDNVTPLTNKTVWLEIYYNGSSSHPLQTMASSFPTDVLASATNLSSSSETWTAAGLTNLTPQKLEVTVTPQLAGYITCRVCVAIVGDAILVDPDPVLS